ncbi:MAG: hypothetical protein VX700_06075 [Pseudomonadota bacterium]|nr:hypothetical protein [Pseudomonadota bacterium]
MTPPEGAEVHFNNWYNDHHMPSHVYGVPGFQSGQRYKVPDRPDYLAIYDLESPATLTDGEYINRKYKPDAPTKMMLSNVIAFTRYIGDEISFQIREGLTIDEALDAQLVLGVFIELPDDAVEEFVDWYRTEHTPMVLASPLWRMVRHMQIVDADPNPFTHMFLHYIESEDALKSDELEAARATEWRNRLAQNDWFKTHPVIYHRHGKRYHKGEPEAATFTLNI